MSMRFFNVQMCECANVRMCKCANVQMCEWSPTYAVIINYD